MSSGCIGCHFYALAHNKGIEKVIMCDYESFVIFFLCLLTKIKIVSFTQGKQSTCNVQDAYFESLSIWNIHEHKHQYYS